MSQAPDSSFSITVSNVGVKLETVGGLVYPHHIFGPGTVLVDDNSKRLLLPGANGEVFTTNGGVYHLESVQEEVT